MALCPSILRFNCIRRRQNGDDVEVVLAGFVHLPMFWQCGADVCRQIDMASEKPKKNPAAVALGRLGGLKGGKARAAKLTPEQRSEIARKAGKNRWAKKKP